MEKYHIISCHVLWRELCYFSSLSPNSFNFHFLKQGLHNTPDILRRELQQAINQVKEEYSAILIGYGLCSNGIEGITARDTKLVIMRGHDCITFLLGSKEWYQDYFNRQPGTYWYSPGWIDTTEMPGEKRFHKLLQTYIEKYGEDNAQYLLEMDQSWINKYSNAAYVDLGFRETRKYKQFTQKCAEWLGWQYDELTGNPQLIKNFLDGNWDSEDFLIVEPGETVIASHDNQIISVKKP